VEGDRVSELRVVTWNIHHGADARNRLDLAAVARVLAYLDADVVALQEVDRHWGSRSGHVDQPGWLAGRLGLQVRYAANVRRRRMLGRTREYGLALLSRERLVDVRHRSYDTAPGQEQRGYLAGRTGAGVRSLRVCCTHLDARAGAEGEQARAGQVERLVSDLAPGTATVLAGDFNCDDDEVAPAMLAQAGYTDAFAACGSGPGATLGDPVDGRRIDRIWVRGGLRVVQAEVVDTAASDHRPLLATLRR
jgi:endonuclease/exonuclease/phosphatase family metal-dependent hydrolase